MRRRIVAIAAGLVATVLTGCSVPPLDLPDVDLPSVGPTTIDPGQTTCTDNGTGNTITAG